MIAGYLLDDGLISSMLSFSIIFFREVACFDLATLALNRAIPDFVGENIQECISNPENKIDLSYDGWVSVNDILMEEGHAYEYDGGKKKVFNG